MTAGAVHVTNDRLRAVLDLLKKVEECKDDSFVAICPAHDDHRPSLRIVEGRDGRVLLKCRAGCTPRTVCAALGISMADLFPPKSGPDLVFHPRGYDMHRPTPAPARSEPAASPIRIEPSGDKGDRGRIVATYDYRDADGTLVFQTVRLDPKDFRQRRPADSGWIWKLGETPTILYRLPDVLAAAQDGRRIFVVEGEKDADALAAEGYVATTSPMGANNWRDGYAEAFRGAEVVILPDNDEPGHAYATQVATACAALGCPVKIVDLPGLPPKGDVSDWLAAGHTLDALDARIEATPLWRAPRPEGKPWRLDELWADEAIMRPPPPVVPYLAWAGRSTLLASAEKAGKSTLTGFVGAAVSRGGRFLDEPCARGDVLLVGLEEFIGDAARRLRQFHADPTRIYLVDRLPGDPRERPRVLAALIDDLRPALVIVDSLIAFSEGAVNDAGSSAQMGPLVQTFTTLAHDTGAAVVIIHHARKQDGKYRDSSAIGGAVDLICEMFAPDEDADPLKRELRARGRVPTRHVTFRLVTDAQDAPSGYVRDHANAARTLEDRVVDFLATSPGASSAAVCHAIGGRKQSVIDVLTRLLQAGRISDTGHGRNAPGGTSYRLISGAN